MHVTELSNAKVYRCSLDNNIVLTALVLHIESKLILVTRFGDYQYSDIHGTCVATKRVQFPFSIPSTGWCAEVDYQETLCQLISQRWTPQISMLI
jgi:hypothetical protein